MQLLGCGLRHHLTGRGVFEADQELFDLDVHFCGVMVHVRMVIDHWSTAIVLSMFFRYILLDEFSQKAPIFTSVP